MSEPYGAMADFRQITLDRLPVGIQQELSQSVLQSARLDITQQAAERMVMRLKAYVLAQHLDRHTEKQSEVVEFEIPDGWREQWKQDHQDAAGWLIRWMARHRPVRTRSLRRRVNFSATWDQYAAFPEASIVVDDRLGAPVRWLTSSSDIRSR